MRSNWKMLVTKRGEKEVLPQTGKYSEAMNTVYLNTGFWMPLPFEYQTQWSGFQVVAWISAWFKSHYLNSLTLGQNVSVGGRLACLRAFLAATSMDLPLHVVHNPPLKGGCGIITTWNFINFLNQGCVWGNSLYEKLWDHLVKREKLDLGLTKHLKFICVCNI